MTNESELASMRQADDRAMSIGAVAAHCAIPSNTIRFYEDIGLLAIVPRQANGHRIYGETEIRLLQFIKRARSVGFSVDDVRTLLSLWRDRRISGPAVTAVATEYLAALDRKVAEASALRQMLAALVERHAGEHRATSPVVGNPPDDGAVK
ncbi:MAG: MerR family transcriptional regulator [Alphaproteobacteria bacterium]